MSAHPAVSVVIPTRDRAASLGRALSALGDIVAEGRTAVRLVLRHPETLPALPPGRYGRRGRPERAVLRAILALDRGTGVATSAGIATVAALARLGLFPRRLIRRVFDYPYWHGVDQELVRAGFRGPLAGRLEALRRAAS